MTRPMTVRAPESESPPSPPSAVAAVAFAERPRNRWSDDDDGGGGDAENNATEWRRRLLLLDVVVDSAAPGHAFNAEEEPTAADDDKLLPCAAAARADARQRASIPREERMPRPCDGRSVVVGLDEDDKRGMGFSACAGGVFGVSFA